MTTRNMEEQRLDKLKQENYKLHNKSKRKAFNILQEKYLDEFNTIKRDLEGTPRQIRDAALRFLKDKHLIEFLDLLDDNLEVGVEIEDLHKQYCPTCGQRVQRDN